MNVLRTSGLVARGIAFRRVGSAMPLAASAGLSAIWRRNLSDDLRSKLDKAVKENDVLVFMKGNKEAPQCGFSRAVVQVLQIQGVKDFKTVNILADDDIRAGVKEYSSWPTIPQVYVKGEFVGGCDILINMHQSGELDTLLKEKGIITEPPVAEAETGAPKA